MLMLIYCTHETVCSDAPHPDLVMCVADTALVTSQITYQVTSQSLLGFGDCSQPQPHKDHHRHSSTPHISITTSPLCCWYPQHQAVEACPVFIRDMCPGGASKSWIVTSQAQRAPDKLKVATEANSDKNSHLPDHERARYATSERAHHATSENAVCR